MIDIECTLAAIFQSHLLIVLHTTQLAIGRCLYGLFPVSQPLIFTHTNYHQKHQKHLKLRSTCIFLYCATKKCTSHKVLFSEVYQVFSSVNMYIKNMSKNKIDVT